MKRKEKKVLMSWNDIQGNRSIHIVLVMKASTQHVVDCGYLFDTQFIYSLYLFRFTCFHLGCS